MARHGTWRTATLVAASAVAVATRADAQDSTRAPAAAYRTVSVALAVAAPIAEGALAPWWDAGRGVRLDVHVPFYVGEVGGWAMRVPYTAQADAQPDFDAWVVALEWRFSPFSTSRIRPHLGVSAGNFLTTFDGIETKGLAKESEILVGASGGLAVRVSGATSLSATLTGLQVLTSTPIRLGFATIGIAHTVRTPGWLRGVIE